MVLDDWQTEAGGEGTGSEEWDEKGVEMEKFGSGSLCQTRSRLPRFLPEHVHLPPPLAMLLA